MEGLPFLPGNTFKDPTKSQYHVSQTLSYRNGFQVPKAFPERGIGGEPLKVCHLNQSELDELANYQPTLTYSKARQEPPASFVPAHVAFDKKVLRFYGYFKETVNESPLEHFRIRHVVIYYYLEDDSISIVEPPQSNSGIPQGKLIRRQRIPKNEVGDHYTWKDINMGMNLAVYGRVYRITECDKYTKDFLESEGVVVNAPEAAPADPYLSLRSQNESIKSSKTPSSFDKRKQFLEMDRRVLRFFAIWDDRDEMFGECRNFVIHYYLADDTMEVKEGHSPNDGRDPFPMLIRRGKIPKNRDDVVPTFPNIVMELSDKEIKEYFSPGDFKIGSTVVILGRRFLLYDCDNFTKAWYYQHFGTTDFTPIPIQTSKPQPPKMELPPYNGYGSLEDSLSSTKSFVPQPPKIDFAKLVDNGNKLLRYEARLDSLRPEDRGRRFIIAYRLGDDMISIFETATRNSGFPGGSFLKRSRVGKPGSTPDHPCYYGPADFKIGSPIDVFGTRFVITNADAHVLTFMEANRDQFPDDVIEALRERLIETESQRPSKELLKGAPVRLRRRDGDVLAMMQDIKWQLKKMAITDKARIDDMFLSYNRDRKGYIDVRVLQDMCRKMQLPDDEDVLSALIDENGTDGKMDLEQFRKFFEG